MYFIHLHHICGINRETGVSQGSRSQSRQDTPSVTAAMSSFDFHLKCNNSSIFHSIFMLLIQMHKLETLNLFWGSKVNLGSFGVIGVKF